MIKTKSGFTIVELLIVIVVIGILAAITIVAYNGIQGRARDNSRYSDVKLIMKALELYKVDKGTYPVMSASNVTGTATCPSHNNGYSFSDATDGTWLKELVDGKYLAKVPGPPSNGCTSFYQYLYPGASNYNCPSRTINYYVLIISGTDGAFTPSDASDPVGGGNWAPCAGSTVGWGAGNTNWIFAKDDV